MWIINEIYGYEVLDSRGSPTIAIQLHIISRDGNFTRAIGIAPSGASCGKREVVERRDGDPMRYHGKGLLCLIDTIYSIRRSICGRYFSCCADLDEFLINLDGSPDKSNLGGNLTIAISIAFAKGIAQLSGLELWQYLRKEVSGKFWMNCKSQYFQALQSANHDHIHGSKEVSFNAYEELYMLKSINMPRLMMNIINGGAHADNLLSFQEFMIVPNQNNIHEDVRLGSEIFQLLKSILHDDGYSISVGDEGGFAPALRSNEEALKYISRAIDKIKELRKNDDIDVHIALDVAASEFYDDSIYKLYGENLMLNAEDLAKYYIDLIKKFNIMSIEDPFDEDSNSDWMIFRDQIAKEKDLRCMRVGDDISTTNSEAIAELGKQYLIDAVIIKPNQVGTLTEAMRAVDIAKSCGMKIIASHRSGETEDTWIADFAVAIGADFLKAGSSSRGERTAKYNRLLEIGSFARYCK